MRRIVVLGTGTAVGKTYFAERLIRALAVARPLEDVVGIKAIETGIRSPAGRSSPERARDAGPPPRQSDAWRLERVSRGTPIRPHPVQGFSDAVSAHLAARRDGRSVNLHRIAECLALHATTIHGWQIVEMAGGVFSPVSRKATNIDLALALEPSIWVVVAPDALGVLHDVRATLLAMHTCARAPDHLVLSAARSIDASSGTNAAELSLIGLPRPAAVLHRGDDAQASLAPLVAKILKARPARSRRR